MTDHNVPPIHRGEHRVAAAPEMEAGLLAGGGAAAEGPCVHTAHRRRRSREESHPASSSSSAPMEGARATRPESSSVRAKEHRGSPPLSSHK
jgi:hypothetical protein